MNIGRLAMLEDKIRKLPPAKLQMTTWAQSEDVCGTAGCAVGWATTIPSFKEAGFFLKKGAANIVFPFWEESTGWEAVRRFFELSYDQGNTLFDSYSYNNNPSPAQVADRIHEMWSDEYHRYDRNPEYQDVEYTLY